MMYVRRVLHLRYGNCEPPLSEQPHRYHAGERYSLLDGDGYRLDDVRRYLVALGKVDGLDR